MHVEHFSLIGQTGEMDGAPPGLRVAVKILDAKTSYGHRRVLVTPVAGSGALWVALARVTLPYTGMQADTPTPVEEAHS